jgi:hypothetical protein
LLDEPEVDNGRQLEEEKCTPGALPAPRWINAGAPDVEVDVNGNTRSVRAV